MFNEPCSRRDFLALAGAAVGMGSSGLAWAARAPAADGAARSAYARTVLASAPVAYWRLGESRGSVAHDATGHGHVGSYSGRPDLGQFGAIAADKDRAIGLNGPRSQAHVAIPDKDAFSIATSGQGMTVEVWMRPDVLDFHGEEGSEPGDFIHWLGKGEKYRYEWGFRFYRGRSRRPNRLSAYVWNPDGKLGAGAYVEERLTPRVWIHLVATFDDPRQSNAQVRLYKNGVPSSHNSSRGTLYRSYNIRPRHGRAPLRLGTRDCRSFLTGGLDEVALYPRVLDAEEILRHWKTARRG